jgi:hypothetical protein
LFLFTFNLSFSQQKRDSINSLNNKPNKTVFKCHPNPAENELFILGTHKIKTVEFLDALGNQAVIYHFNKSIIRIDVSHLKRDIYLLKVIDEFHKVGTKKLVLK